MALPAGPIGSEGRVAFGAVVICAAVAGGEGMRRAARDIRPAAGIVTIRALPAEVWRGRVVAR